MKFFTNRTVFEAAISRINGYTPGNSSDEWDLCVRLYKSGYKNYRTLTAYAYHKQGSRRGGIQEIIREGNSIGTPAAWIKMYVDGYLENNSGYFEFSGRTRVNERAHAEHNSNNRAIWSAVRRSLDNAVRLTG